MREYSVKRLTPLKFVLNKRGKHFTDGITYVKSVRFPEGVISFNWYEIAEEEYNKLQEEFNEEIN